MNCLSFLSLFAIAAHSVMVENEQHPEVFHAGHEAHHTMRLARLEGEDGMDTLEESEKRWADSEEEDDFVLDPSLNQGETYFRISEKSMKGLRAHHKAKSLLETESDSLVATADGESQPDMNGKRDDMAEGDSDGDKNNDDGNNRDGSHKAKVGAASRLSSIGALYVGPIGIGTPRKDLWVVYDTGSTNIWIATDLCNAACKMKGRKYFKHQDSDTFNFLESHVNLRVKFGTGALYGPLAQEDFHVGPAKVTHQVFAMMEKQHGHVFKANPFEGIVGLGFPTLATKSAPPFFDSIIDQKALPHNEFSVYLVPSNPSASGLFWGGVDSAFYDGDIEFFPVVDPFYWSLHLHSFKIGNHTILGEDDGDSDKSALEEDEEDKGEGDEDESEYEEATRDDEKSGGAFVSKSSKEKSGGDSTPHYMASIKPLAGGPRAIVDTGTTYFTAEASKFGKVMKYLPKADCNSMNDETHPPITISLMNSAGAKRDFIMHFNHYMVSHSGDMCSPAFMNIPIPAAHGPGMMLGEVFLKHHYTVFDRADGGLKNARVGFGKAVHTKKARQHMKHITKGQESFARSRRG